MTLKGLLTRVKRLYIVAKAKRIFPYRSVFVRVLRRETRRSMARINKKTKQRSVVYAGR